MAHRDVDYAYYLVEVLIVVNPSYVDPVVVEDVGINLLIFSSSFGKTSFAKSDFSFM